MRILIAGSNLEGALEKYYLKYLQKEDCTVSLFNSHGRFADYYHKNITRKLLFRAGLSSILPRINKDLLHQAEAYKPDIVWVFKGMEIYPRTIQLLRGKGIRLVNYNPDNPFLFSGRGSGNRYVTESIPFYHAHFSYNREILQQFEQMRITSYWLPFGYDVDEALLSECYRQPEVVKACFVGSPDKIRADFFNSIADAGMEIDVYGSGWQRFALHKNITIHGAVYNADFWKTLHRYRVQLNIMRPHNLNSHGMRSFEVPGVAGLQVAARTDEHRIFFKEDEEIFLFSDVQECCAKITNLLRESTEKASFLRKAARAKCESAQYSYKHRAKQALEFFKQL
jgi:spore maturation protein CgeB